MGIRQRVIDWLGNVIGDTEAAGTGTTADAAEALCKTAVNAAPTAMPRSGWEKAVSICRKRVLSRRGETAVLMLCMPNIKTAKPRRMSPIWWCACFLENIRSRMPTTATVAESVDVDSRDTQPVPSRLERLMIQPVMLVPIRAP